VLNDRPPYRPGTDIVNRTPVLAAPPETVLSPIRFTPGADDNCTVHLTDPQLRFPQPTQTWVITYKGDTFRWPPPNETMAED
jgi:hypothetical protein